MALVRYVLAEENMLDLGRSVEDSEIQGEEDREILLEAIIRDNERWTKE